MSPLNALGLPPELATAQGGGPALPGSAGSATDPARRVAEEFETFFLARFIETMQAGIATDGPFGGGQGEAMFRGLLSDEMAKSVTRAGGVGIADAVYREIIKLQEAQQA